MWSSEWSWVGTCEWSIPWRWWRSLKSSELPWSWNTWRCTQKYCHQVISSSCLSGGSLDFLIFNLSLLLAAYPSYRSHSRTLYARSLPGSEIMPSPIKDNVLIMDKWAHKTVTRRQLMKIQQTEKTYCVL
jgi:hypothetical protein